MPALKTLGIKIQEYKNSCSSKLRTTVFV